MHRLNHVMCLLLIVYAISMAASAPAHAHGGGGQPVPAQGQGPKDPPAALAAVAFEQRLNQQVPLDLPFRDETGRSVTLREYVGQQSAILLPLYYSCETLCPLALDGLTRSLRPVPLEVGRDFGVIILSINPREPPSLAAKRKSEVLLRNGRPEGERGWHFLTGDETAIRAVTSAIGFRYTYDAKTDQYAHPAGVVLLTPEGKAARYFYGIDFPPRDLHLGLIEAADRKIATLIDQAVLYCYRYDALTGKYGLVVMNVVRLGGVLTVLALGAFLLVMFRRDRRTARL